MWQVHLLMRGIRIPGALIGVFAAAVLTGLLAFVALAPRQSQPAVPRAGQEEPFAVLTSRRALDSLRDYSAETYDRYPGCNEVDPGDQPVTCQGALRLMTIGTGLSVVFVGAVGVQVVQAEISSGPGVEQRILIVRGRAGAKGDDTRTLTGRQIYLGVNGRRFYSRGAQRVRATRFAASNYALRFVVPRRLLDGARRRRDGLRLTFTWPDKTAAGAKRIGVVVFGVPPDPS